MIVRINPNAVAINIQNGRHFIRNHKPNSLGFKFQVSCRFAIVFLTFPLLRNQENFGWVCVNRIIAYFFRGEVTQVSARRAPLSTDG
jgi:hypothetical protein